MPISYLNSLCFGCKLWQNSVTWEINDLLSPVSNFIWHSVPSSNFPTVCPCSDIAKFSPALILVALVMSVFRKYVVLKSEISRNLVLFDTFDWTPSYTSKYSLPNFSGLSPKSISNVCLSSSFNLLYIFYDFSDLRL